MAEEEWLCSCGSLNTTKFCPNCGKDRAEGGFEAPEEDEASADMREIPVATDVAEADKAAGGEDLAAIDELLAGVSDTVEKVEEGWEPPKESRLKAFVGGIMTKISSLFRRKKPADEGDAATPETPPAPQAPAAPKAAPVAAPAALEDDMATDDITEMPDMPADDNGLPPIDDLPLPDIDDEDAGTAAGADDVVTAKPAAAPVEPPKPAGLLEKINSSAKLKAGVIGGAIVLAIAIGGAVGWALLPKGGLVVDEETGEVVESGVFGDDAPRKPPLMLGDVLLGDYAETVLNHLGPEVTREEKYDRIYYNYDDLTLVVKDEIVIGLEANSSKISTPYGIHKGSSYQEVVDAYGTNANRSKYDGGPCYEYAFKTKDERIGYVRFAVSYADNRVCYVSLYMPESDDNAGLKENDSSKQAKEKFIAYREAINSHKYQEAYDCFTPDMQKKMGTIATYAAACAGTLSSKVTAVNVVTATTDEITLEIAMTDRERNSNGDRDVNYTGKAVMVMRNGQWLINEFFAAPTK